MAVPKRFGMLRFVGNLLKVLAWIFLVICILAAIALAIGFGTDFAGALIPSGWELISGIGGGIALLLVGLIYFLTFYALGESLMVQLAVEENTRLTAALLLRMHQESQDTTAGYAGSGFVGEPFEQ